MKSESKTEKYENVMVVPEEGVCLECGGVSLVMVIVTKGTGGGTLQGGRGGERGEVSGWEERLPVFFSKMDFSKLLQKLQISSNSRVKNTF